MSPDCIPVTTQPPGRNSTQSTSWISIPSDALVPLGLSLERKAPGSCDHIRLKGDPSIGLPSFQKMMCLTPNEQKSKSLLVLLASVISIGFHLTPQTQGGVPCRHVHAFHIYMYRYRYRYRYRNRQIYRQIYIDRCRQLVLLASVISIGFHLTPQTQGGVPCRDVSS